MARSCEDLRPNTQSDTDNNPFLFSNFLKKETVVAETAQIWKHFDSSNESVDHAPFPELSAKKVLKQNAKDKKKNSKKLKKKTPNENNKRRVLKIVDDEIQTVDESEVKRVLETCDSKATSEAQPAPNISEDNITDSDGSSSIESSYILEPNTNNNLSNQSAESRIRELEEENTVLKRNIKRLENDLERQREASQKWIDKLMDELRAARKREQEETATLENVVQMVEENLRQTTQRALEAEANVSKMKDEIKFLREETIAKSKHDQIVQDYQFRLESVKEKSRDIAKFMHAAASKTEPLLKEMLSGVASLHIYAEQFENIDKIADIDSNRDRVV